MPYATAQQLVDQYGLTEISQLVSDEESLVSEDLLRDALAGNNLSDYDADELLALERAQRRLAQVMQTQTSYIDSRIGNRYPTASSMTADEINATPLLECCLALARAALCDDDDNLTDEIKADRKHWRDWLGEVSKGTAIIPGLTPGHSADSGGVTQQRIVRQSRSNIDWSGYP